MRKLKLQSQISLDGFHSGPSGALDWMTWEWDDKLKSYVTDITDPVDTILLGRKMTDGFVGHWENVVKNLPQDESYGFAMKMCETPKIVFTKTLTTSPWDNTTLATGDLVKEVNAITDKSGRATFAITSETPGHAQVSATIDGSVQIGQPLTIEFQ